VRLDRAALADVARRVFDADGISAARLDGPAGEALLDSYRAIIGQALAAAQAEPGRLIVLGLCGAQGSGKSTTARVVHDALRELSGLSVVALSLDDLYLSRAAREALARDVHPLLATRGVPGTHDVARGLAVIDSLAGANAATVTCLPRFDKATDEPLGPGAEARVVGRPDVLVFEGWCVGARPQQASALAEPVNELERLEDPQARWRGYVNEQLGGPYRRLFACIDRLVLLRAPRFECVVAWRQEQEHKLAGRLRTAGVAAGASRVMSDAQVARFVMHYERITRHVLEDMPAYADLVVELDAAREVRALRARR